MRKMMMLMVVLISALFTFNSIMAQDDWPVLKGPYLGMTPPGLKASVFAPGLLSINNFSPLGTSISPDGNQLYYTLFVKPGTGVIMVSKMIEGRWVKPEEVSFTGEFSDWDINLSPDGKRLYFSSNRPIPGGKPGKKIAKIWFVEKDVDDWSNPKLLQIPENNFPHKVHPTVAKNGNIYFFTIVPGGGPDLFCSEFSNGKYQMPYNLGSSINTEYNEADPFIAPDESYIIFQSKRPGGYGKNDLYISFRGNTNGWCTAINMGGLVNTTESDKCGRVTFDGKYFIFSRSVMGSKISKFYWIDASFIKNLTN